MRPALARRLALAAAFGLPMAGAQPAEIPDLERGRALYENHCVVCHTSKVHRRIPALPIDLEELRRIVSSWAKQENLSWTPDEIEDVVHYLNRAHYRFER